jgi:general secretion pathway protein G
MQKRRQAFSLVELVVVIMILGILAAVAAPKLLQTSGAATDNGLKQTLTVVRDAIELYAADHGGALPGADGNAATLKTDLAPYLRGTFPECPVGAKDADVKMSSGATALAGVASPTEAWHYNYTTGEFIVNYSAAAGDGTPYEDL